MPRRRALAGWLAASLLVTALGSQGAPAAQANGVELRTLDVVRQDNALLLNFIVQPNLSRAVEDAMQRGIPLYFEAQATVYRPRWYWRDERVARATRVWRLAYQPLTSSWRISLGALNQTVATAQEALDMVSRTVGWKIAEADQVEAGDKYYIEFSYRLDSTQLPRPMQLDLAAQADWRLQVERTLRLD
ncbi:DUF4390 domain-containing protein [Ideonella sp. TBM-1]|uniref:DUF4390 domain-containing protein n=1 Tax=Ideonella livida TaxID=2707176 RepID=A0A7C9PGI3_9BURK|nr:DUF4390 domain-containing protein [Ideonella livida]